MSKDLEAAAKAIDRSTSPFRLQLDGDAHGASLARLQQMSKHTGFQLAAAFGRAHPPSDPAVAARPGFYTSTGMRCFPEMEQPWYNQSQARFLTLDRSQHRVRTIDQGKQEAEAATAADLALSLRPPAPSPSSSTSSSPRAATAPAFSGEFTMLYNGEVRVYQNVAVDKAQAIMLLAGSVASGGLSSGDAAINLLLSASSSSQPCSSNASSISVLPQARKISLSRFLGRRKARCAAAVPYSAKNVAANKR